VVLYFVHTNLNDAMAETNFILVVEDDPILKNLLGHTFAGKYQTLYASNGAEALALFAQYTPALVLLDLMLPDMDGFSILQQIRSRPDASKDVPVIIVSNLGQQSDKDKAKSLGANDYIVKAEVEIEEIVKRIEGILGAPAPVVAAPMPTMPLIQNVPMPQSHIEPPVFPSIQPPTPPTFAPMPPMPAPEPMHEAGVFPMPITSSGPDVIVPAGPQPFTPPPTSM
jgi:CheY-like chemotaxis protein